MFRSHVRHSRETNQIDPRYNISFAILHDYVIYIQEKILIRYEVTNDENVFK